PAPGEVRPWDTSASPAAGCRRRYAKTPTLRCCCGPGSCTRSRNHRRDTPTTRGSTRTFVPGSRSWAPFLREFAGDGLRIERLHPLGNDVADQLGHHLCVAGLLRI